MRDYIWLDNVFKMNKGAELVFVLMVKNLTQLCSCVIAQKMETKSVFVPHRWQPSVSELACGQTACPVDPGTVANATMIAWKNTDPAHLRDVARPMPKAIAYYDCMPGHHTRLTFKWVNRRVVYCKTILCSQFFKGCKTAFFKHCESRNPSTRAGLKPMQLHWAPHLWEPRAMVLRKLVHFFQIPLALVKSVEMACKSHWQTTLSLQLAMNFLYCRMLTNVLNSLAKALHLRSTMVV